MTEEIHDTSHLDRYLQTRQRVSLLNAIWRPMAAGAAGAALVIAAASVVLPRITYRDIEVPRITLRDVTVPNIITKDLEIPIPRVVAPPPPVAANPPSPPSDAPRTPEEQKFHDKPEYRDTAYHGRITKSVDGKAISFAGGKSFWPAHWDSATHATVADPDVALDSDPYVGDLGFCRPQREHPELWDCSAMHGGVEVPIPAKQTDASATLPQSSINSTPTRSTTDMINVEVDVGDRAIEAQVDTGCSYPLSMPSSLADELIKKGFAFEAGTTRTSLADGTEREVRVVMVNAITVEGRVLKDVEAVAPPNPTASVLLGLGALNHLGGYKFEEGRLVFTSERPR